MEQSKLIRPLLRQGYAPYRSVKALPQTSEISDF